MKPHVFKTLVDPLIADDTTEPWQLKPQRRRCEYCQRTVTEQLITCEPYLWSGHLYFKHKCNKCPAILFDGKPKIVKMLQKRHKSQ